MPSTLFIFFAGLLGLCLGSFYNVCIHRSLTNESVVSPARSKCPKCGQFLSWRDNIPLLSFALLRGKCRACGQPISWRYPVVESLSGILAALLAAKFGPGATWVVYMAFSGLLIVLAFIDLASMTLPLYPMIFGAIAALACAPLFLGISLTNAVLAAVIGAGLFWLLRLGYKKARGIEGLGEGDVWLMLLLGPLVGIRLLPFVIVISGVSLIAASVVFVKDAQGNRLQTPIPYGPFLCLATVLAVLVGEDVLQWYLRLVL